MGAMIRFLPDNWLEAWLRFFAMTAPNGNVYVEIAAPDLRFAAIVLLGVAVGLTWRRQTVNRRPAVALLVIMLVSAVPWLMTTGNGRYWIPMLLIAGPLAVGLAYLLPLTRSFRLFLAAGLLVAQTFVVLQVPPWDSWTWVQWAKAPYFHLEVPRPDASALVTTYVTVSSISYSLIAPQFPASSRWINITSIGGTGRDVSWGQHFLAQAKGPLMLVAPSIKGQVTQTGQPTPDIRKALDALIGGQRLALVPDASCRLLRARSLLPTSRAQTVPRSFALSQDEKDAGFWVCPLRYPVDSPALSDVPFDPKVEAGFARIEQMCPRFFQVGAKSIAINGGAMRHYPGSDMKVYVLDTGQVWYKFWRALNPVLVGNLDEVLKGSATIECDHIRGRSGLPWDREI
jgi:hypothetical protein